VTIQEQFDAAIRIHQAGGIADAEAAYRRILAVDPRHADATHMLGIVAHQSGRPAEAVEWIGWAILIDPSKAGFHNNLGNALQAMGKFEEAVNAYRDAVGLYPALADGWNNLGNALQELGRNTEAIEAHRRAISIRPDFAQAWYSLGGALIAADEPDQAIDAYDRALQFRPGFDAAVVNRANLLRHIGRLDESIDALRGLVERRPAPVALSNLIYGMYFHPDYDTSQIGAYLSKWNELFAEPLKKFSPVFANDRSLDRKLRIGYVSPDFNGHPAGRFLLPLLAHHDRERFEIVCYSDVGKADEMTARLQSHCDHWRETRRLSDEQLAALIREDRIDVLVDLTLHLAGNRLLMFARKPAPVQATWLAYPGSSGLSTIDYRVTDWHLDPVGFNDALYSEESVRLPDCYWCYDPLCEPIEIGELPAIQNGFITFGSLNNFAKVTKTTLGLWARVMREVSRSKLLLLAPVGSARTRVLAEMREQGIEPSRIEFAGREVRRKYMAQYQRIDIGLDTFPCNGHTTGFDSLWMGVPIVSLFGSTAMSRAGLSILANLQMRDWVTDDPHKFVALAIKASGDLDRLTAIRSSLRALLEKSPLMDGTRFSRNMEAAFRGMWNRYCEKRDPPAGG
jgi:protein O-GlcNAc transferase